jgi:hypothetical protein
MGLSTMLRAAVLAMVCGQAGAGDPMAASPRSTVTLDNRSGQAVIVNLVGATAHVVEVPDRQQRTVSVAAGEYYLLARYGTEPGGYSYIRGDPFLVVEAADRYSEITITLHGVVDGNYATQPTKCEEFLAALPVEENLDDLPEPAKTEALPETQSTGL